MTYKAFSVLMTAQSAPSPQAVSGALRGIVPVTYVHLLYEYLAQQGLDPQTVLGTPKPSTGAGAGIAAGGLGRYDVKRWQVLLQTASDRLGDALLGLHLGRSVTPRHFGILGYVFLSCGSLGAALQRFDQYQRLLYDVNPVTITMNSLEVTFEWGVDQGRPGALVDECAIATLVQFMRNLVQEPLNPRSIGFVNPAPADLQAYLDYFGCPVQFAQNTTRMVIAAADLQRGLRAPDAALLDMLSQQADTFLAELEPDDTMMHQLQNCLTQQLMLHCEPSLEQAASAMHLSERTLHRRLAERGLQFRAVLDALRCQLARQYLRDQRLQLTEIAALLGYSEQSAFTRAFRRWTGVTPHAYRQSALTGA